MHETTIIHPTLNAFDLGILGLVFLSSLMGVIRGFTRQVLGIGAWVGATAIAFFGFPHVKPLMRELIAHPFISDAVTVAGLFLVSLIIFSMFIQNVAETVKGSALGGIDRSMGLLFGVARAGAVMVVLFFLSGVVWKTPDKRPRFLQDSRLLPWIADGAEAVSRFIPPDYLSKETIRNLTHKIERTPQELMFELANPAPSDIHSGSDSVSDYRNGQRRDMNRLFQNYAD